MRLTGQMIHYRPGFRMDPHADGCRRLSVQVGGLQEEAHRGARVCSSLGSVAIKDADAVHENVFGPQGTTIVSVQLPDAALESLGFEPWSSTPWRWLRSGDDDTFLALRFAAGLRRRAGDIVEECLIELLGRLSAGSPPALDATPERVRRVRDRLHDAPLEAPSVRCLAEGEGLHPVSLGRAFRRVFGMSITRYRQRLRVAAAARALLDTSESLVAVALDHGFADSSHFSRLFRRELGTPPGAFRNRLRPVSHRLDSFKTTWAIDV